MADKIRVFTKRPGCPPRSVWVTNSLANLQNYVDGYIETVTFASDMCVICNEEGLLRGLPYNCTVDGAAIHGDILIVGIDGEEFADVPIDIQELKQMFPAMWEVRV